MQQLQTHPILAHHLGSLEAGAQTLVVARRQAEPSCQHHCMPTSSSAPSVTMSFPLQLQLPSPDDPHPTAGALHASRATPDQLSDPSYWAALCPELRVTQQRPAWNRKHSDVAVQNATINDLQHQVEVEGVAVIPAATCPWRGIKFELLARSIVRLMQAGWPPTFIIMFDEVWQLVEQLAPMMQAVTGNAINLDILAWYVDPNRGHAGFSPHRDRQPHDVAASFRADRTARYTTAWVPLTDACPDNSCLYVIPRWADPGYLAGDLADGPDPLEVALGSKEAYQHVRALPAASGSAVIFTHRIIHWGSRGRLGYHTPRISLSWGCADDGFEPAYHDRAAFLPHPPVALRAALACGQMLAYHERFDLTPRDLALFKAVFLQHGASFHASFRSKVLQEFVAATRFVADPANQGAGTGWHPAAAAAVAAETAPASLRQEQPALQGPGGNRQQSDKKDPDAEAAKKRKQVGGPAVAAPTHLSVPKDQDQAAKGAKKKRKKKAEGQGQARKRLPSQTAQQGAGASDDDEGPGFDWGLQGARDGLDLDGGSPDLEDEALDALLEAEVAGLNAELVDDFSGLSDEERPQGQTKPVLPRKKKKKKVKSAHGTEPHMRGPAVHPPSSRPTVPISSGGKKKAKKAIKGSGKQ